MLNEKYILNAIAQLSNNKSLMKYIKNNPNICFNKHYKPNNKGSNSNDYASKSESQSFEWSEEELCWNAKISCRNNISNFMSKYSKKQHWK